MGMEELKVKKEKKKKVHCLTLRNFLAPIQLGDIFFSRSLSIERNLSINVLCSKRELLDRTLIALGTTSQRRVD